MNPKIVAEPVPALEAQDYPRWTVSMVEVLAGIKQFRDELERRRP